jgi:hypothetical protein
VSSGEIPERARADETVEVLKNDEGGTKRLR